MVDFIQRVSVTMPAPTLVSGRPEQPWEPSDVDRSDWGKLQLIINGHDCTRVRGKRWIPLSDRDTEPFGDAEAAFALPGLTEYDIPADFHIKKFAPVRWRRKDADGDFHVLYEGEIADFEPDTGMGLVVQCIGTLYRTDLLKEPPEINAEPADAGRLIARAFNRKRRHNALHIGEMAHVHTGIKLAPNPDFGPFLTGAIQDYLSQLTTDDGGQWTIKVQRPRTPKLVLKDTTTVDATVTYGAPGVEVNLSLDFTTAITAIYGTGSNGHCTWMGARFPNLVQEDVPDFPLSVGAVFTAGSGTSGFAPFAAYLRRGQYGTIVSDDTYAAADIDNVEQMQDRAGITVDGIVGAQTWEAAFQPGANQGSLRGAYVDTIWEKSETRRWWTNAQGALHGGNPGYDSSVHRIEDYIPFGDNVSKQLGRRSAKQAVNRDYPAGRVGTITLRVCPEEICRFQLKAGMNITVKHFNDDHPVLHIVDRTRNWQEGTVTLVVDEKARDLLTLAAIHQRDKDVSDLTRRQRFGRRKSKVFDDYGTWLCEDGAGEIPLMNQQGGFWNVQRIPAGPKGPIERISLALGSGLTEHLLNVDLSEHPDATIPGATRGAVAIFAKPVTANALANTLGADPLHVDVNGKNPWDREADKLARKGMIYAAGGPSNGIGFYPNTDPGDGSGTGLTGRFEDGGGVPYGPTGKYWLWVAIWTEASCKVAGRLFPGAP